MATARTEIVDAIRAAGRALQLREIFAALPQFEESTLRQTLSQMAQEGELTKPRHGYYNATEDQSSDEVRKTRDTGMSQAVAVHRSDDASLHPMALALRDTVSLTLLTDVKASAGRLNQGVVVYDEGQRISVKVPRLFLRQLLGFDPPVELGIMRADGDSMRPVFEDGDMLLYVPRRDLDGDGNYIVLVGGEVYAKRCQRIPGGGVKVISANKADGYQDWHLLPNPDADEDMPLLNQLTNRPVSFVVAGKIVWPQRDTGRVHVERVAEIIRTILREGPSQPY